MSVTFKRATKKGLYNFTYYRAYKDGKYVGKVYTHSGFNFWIACVELKGKTKAIKLKGVICGNLQDTKKELIEVLEDKQPLIFSSAQ